MEQVKRSFVVKFVLIFSLAVPLESVSVRPVICPTNKIAPHRRITSWERPNGRTFAAYYDLLSPHSSQTKPQNQASLQEQHQSDQPGDCGDIEDYDENDLSSVTHQQQTRNSRSSDNRWFFGLLGNRPPHQLPAYKPPTPATPPSTSHHKPQRPPYWSGGLLSNNYYKPPLNQVPSDNYKPVHEATDSSEPQQTYLPGVVGGPLLHVVGLTRPTVATTDENVRRRLEYIDSLRLQSTQPSYAVTRRPRPRKLSNDNSVIGSFVNLFFK